ncbi:MAG: iron-sulfur cluster assembly accessory protein [Thiomonas sp.]|nr:iron-sulfur cluster assembly accessory protein [Thiomonas sp.]
MALTHLTITPAAEKFMRRIVRFSGLPAGAGFRLLVSAGGCSGYSTEFNAEAAPEADDEVFNAGEGLQLFLPAESRLLLEGATLDFIDTPMQSGLSVRSPAASSCGCSSAGGAEAIPAAASVPMSALLRR